MRTRDDLIGSAVAVFGVIAFFAIFGCNGHCGRVVSTNPADGAIGIRAGIAGAGDGGVASCRAGWAASAAGCGLAASLPRDSGLWVTSA